MVAVEELLTRGGEAVKFFIHARKSTEDEARQILSIDAQLDDRSRVACPIPGPVVQTVTNSPEMAP